MKIDWEFLEESFWDYIDEINPEEKEELLEAYEKNPEETLKVFYFGIYA